MLGTKWMMVCSDVDADEDPDACIEDEDWVPTTASGKQKSPNVIRGEIRRFIGTGELTQTSWLKSIGINNNSFGRFMTGKYKDQWSACSNGTYWSAARDLEKRRRRTKREAKSGSSKKKRKAGDSGSGESSSSSSSVGSGSSKKSKKQAAQELLDSIVAVPYDLVCDGPVFDDCDSVRRKINKFMRDSGATQAAFCRALGQGEACQTAQLNTFLRRKGAGDGAASKVYRLAYHFFEQKRILDCKPQRMHAQRYGAKGKSLRHDNGMRWTFVGDAQ